MSRKQTPGPNMSFLLIGIMILLVAPMTAEAVHVNGYYRGDGTYVRSHYRSSPSRSVYYNSYSFDPSYGFMLYAMQQSAMQQSFGLEQMRIKQAEKERKRAIRYERAQENADRQHQRIQKGIEQRTQRNKEYPQFIPSYGYHLSPYRNWIDSTGVYNAEARFISYGRGVVVLEKVEGIVKVPLDRLSIVDKMWIDDKRRQ